MSSNDWKRREAARFKSGEYRALPWAADEWWREASEIHADHYAHLSVERDSKIAFTVDAKKGEADRQTRMKPGRYLNRYFAGVLSPESIRDLAGSIDLAEGSVAYAIATTPDEIEQVYREGPRSCMSGEHACATRPYGAGDLGVAYIESDGNTGLTGEREISCRVLVWPAKKIYSRVYGDESRLIPLLREDGYVSAGRMGFAGARLLRIEANSSGAYYAPYFDGNERAEESECGAFYILGDSGHSLSSTGGLIGGTMCRECGECVEEDESVYALDDTWCESCAQDSLFYCEGCDEYNHNDEAVCIDGDAYWCNYCAENRAFCCEGCNDWFSNDNAQSVDDGILCESCFEESGAGYCDECGDCYTTLHTVHESGEESVACESCADAYFTECDECDERRRDTTDWRLNAESCDECARVVASDGAQTILDESFESFEDCGRLLLPAVAASGGYRVALGWRLSCS
jgi:hypothetical protein